MTKKKDITKFRCIGCSKLKPDTNVRAIHYVDDEDGYPIQVLYCKKCNDKMTEGRE